MKQEINRCITLNILYLIFSILIIVTISINIQNFGIIYVVEIFLSDFSESDLFSSYYEKHVFIEHIKQYVNNGDFSYYPALAIFGVILLIQIFFRMVQDRPKEFFVNSCKNDEDEISKIKKHIKNKLNYFVEIRFTRDFTFVTRRKLYLSMKDLARFMSQEKEIEFILHHEIHHVLAMDDIFSPLYEPIINFIKYFTIVIVVAILIELHERFELYEIRAEILIFIFVYSVNFLVSRLSSSYKKLREYFADNYAYQRLDKIYSGYGQRNNVDIVLKKYSNSPSEKNLYIISLILYILLLNFLYFNPVKVNYLVVSVFPYSIFIVGMLLSLYLIFYFKKSNIKILVVLSLFYIVFLLKIKILSFFCKSVFLFLNKCHPYVIF